MTKRTAARPLIATFMLLTFSALAVSAQEQKAIDPANGKVLAVSQTQRLASDEEVTSLFILPSEAKEFLVPFSGTIRLTWQVRAEGGGFDNASVSVESSLGGCFNAPVNQTTNSDTYVNGRCNVQVLAGDVIKVQVSANFLATGYLRNVRVFYDIKPASGKGKVLPPAQPFASLLSVQGRVS